MTLHTATEADALATSADKLAQQLKQILDLSTADPTPKNRAAAVAAFEAWNRFASANPEEKIGWGLEWIEDFMARDFPIPSWIYMDLVQAKTTCVIMAPPNAGKTLLALDLGAQIVAKVTSAGASGMRAAIIEEEGSGGAFQRRLARAFAAAGGMPRQAVKVAWSSGRDLTTAVDLEQLAAECAGADLIVLDSLADLTDVDENDPGEMKRLGKALRRLQTLTGATIVVLHHMTKEAWRPGEAPSLRHLRGHGALAGKVDTVLALVPGDEESGRVNFDLYCLKQRDEERARPRHATVIMEGPAAVVEMTPFKQKQPADNGKLEAEILSNCCVQTTGLPMSKKKLAAVLQKNETDIGIAVERMVKAGTLIRVGTWNLYQPPPGPLSGG